jgi:hypothetical protein
MYKDRNKEERERETKGQRQKQKRGKTVQRNKRTKKGMKE